MIAAVQGAAAYLQPETLVSLESTTYPGTTDDVIRPILGASGLIAEVDFNLAFSPERIDPVTGEGDQRSRRERRPADFSENLSKRSSKGRSRPK